MKKKHVLFLTGATGDIGQNIALQSAREGMDVVLCFHRASNESQLLYERIVALGSNVLVLQGDLSDPLTVSILIQKTLEHFGHLSTLVNNAGFLHQQHFEDISIEEWDHTLNVNLRAPFLLAQACFPIMRKNGGGHIINIASSGGQLGGPLAPHYAASKAGLICLTKSLARLGAKDNIISHAISPGLIVTKMSAQEMSSEAGREKLESIPLHRAGTPHEVAELVLLLAKGKMDYATGQTINLNGGLYMG